MYIKKAMEISKISEERGKKEESLSRYETSLRRVV